MCYWQQRINLTQIDPFICTHIVLSFIDSSVEGNVSTSVVTEGRLAGLIAMKSQNPDLKIMISLFNNFRAISTNFRETFAQNLLNFVQAHNLDGADIDWEWPSASDRINYEAMLKMISDLFKPRGLILTAAIGACANLDTSYTTAGLLTSLDFVNVMTYNLHGGTWENSTANPGNYWDPNSRYSVITCLNHWIKKGMPHEKMIVGIPTHSRNYILDDPNVNGIGAPAHFKAWAAEGTPTAYSYNVLCKNVLENGWTKRYEYDTSTGPYAFFGTMWSGYDDLQSVRQKAKLIDKVGFGGAVFWSLDHDDHSNVCGDGTFPLIRLVGDMIRK